MKKYSVNELNLIINEVIGELRGRIPGRFQTEEELERYMIERGQQREDCIRKLVEVQLLLINLSPSQRIENSLLRGTVLLLLVKELYTVLQPEVSPIIEVFSRALGFPG